MEIKIVPRDGVPGLDIAEEQIFPLLIIEFDAWNDFSYQTLCVLHVVRELDSEPVRLGRTKIMRLDQPTGEWTFEGVTDIQKRLPLNYCSLSVEDEYYYAVASLGRTFGGVILQALRDAAFNPAVWRRFERDRCFKISLLRETSVLLRIRDLVPRLFGKRTRLIKTFNFFFRVGSQEVDSHARFDFRKVRGLPHRIALVVGANGAGKTQLLSKLAISLTGATKDSDDPVGNQEALRKRSEAGNVAPLPSFYAVVAVSYNAFDNFEIPSIGEQARYAYRYCGLRTESGTLKSPDEISAALEAAVGSMEVPKRNEFLEMVQRIVPDYVDGMGLPNSLSAGQKIVFSILADLVTYVSDNTLVLMDEPETHLHPTLIVSLLSELTLLLERRKSFAIVATHSPLIAQQIPRHKVSIVSREMGMTVLRRPQIESFGADLSDLAVELFDAVEYRRDYTAIIDDLLRRNGNSPERVERLFEGRLESNALMYLWSAAEGSE